jgi:hypothetical protein
MFSIAQRTAGTVAALITGRQKYRYQTVQGDVDEEQEFPLRDSRRPQGRNYIRRAIIAAVSILGAALFVYWVVV